MENEDILASNPINYAHLGIIYDKMEYFLMMMHHHQIFIENNKYFMKYAIFHEKSDKYCPKWAIFSQK